jgi:hypothetical protein
VGVTPVGKFKVGTIELSTKIYELFIVTGRNNAEIQDDKDTLVAIGLTPTPYAFSLKKPKHSNILLTSQK